MTNDTTRQTDHCPTCGAAVRVLSGDEGTHSYTPVTDDTTRQAGDLTPAEVDPVENLMMTLFVHGGFGAHSKRAAIRRALRAAEARGKQGERRRILAELELLRVHLLEIAREHPGTPSMKNYYRTRAAAIHMAITWLTEGNCCHEPRHVMCQQEREKPEDLRQ